MILMVGNAANVQVVGLVIARFILWASLSIYRVKSYDDGAMAASEA
jgi:hypothetical protein